MVQKTRTIDITITDDKSTLASFFRRAMGESEYDFEGVSALRKLLSNEKTRLLHIIKIKKPKSIYQLAKMSERNFKSVFDDVKLLERFGFVDFVPEKTGSRNRIRPILVSESLTINLRI